jgi:CHAT domain-containing protein
VATALNNLADARAHIGRKADAEQLFRRSLAIREKSLGPNHLDVAVSLDNIVDLICDDDRYAEAEPLARRSLAIRQAALGQAHPLVADSLNNLAVILDNEKRPQEAEPLLKQALDIRLRALGEAHPDVANSYNNLGGHYLDLKDWQRAYDAFGRAATILNSRRTVDFDEQQTRADLKIHQDTNPYPGMIVAAYNLAATPGNQQAVTLRSQAFEAAQWTGDAQAAKAIAGMSARVAAGNSDLAARVRQRQDLNEQTQAIDRMLIAILSQPDAARNPPAEQALRTWAVTIANQIKELDRSIAAQFPDYTALMTRAPISIEDVQKQLKPNEALLLFTTTAHFTFIWTVTPSDVHWHAAAMGEKQLTETIGILRCGLDAEAWIDQTQGSCVEKLGLKQPPDLSALPFDLPRAYALYQALLGPVEKDVEGKQLILVPSGPLATLPFEVLLTDKPADNGQPDLAQAPWLVKRFATTVLPSVSSLKALRQIAKSKATRLFIGFGNPLLDGDGQDPSDSERARLARLRQSCADIPELQTNQIALRAVRSVINLTGGSADLAQLKHQEPLPETAFELCSVANSFTPVKGDVYLGSEATEAKLKALSESGRLAQYRILHFATHGALSGQVRGSIEPGLILTPPATATPTDDGYLTSSEISALKLDADWIVLSACNTAGGEESNSEAFAGLARAFFYAGARALLVSHWPVNSDAAVAITTGTTAAMIAHPDIGRAEALRRSISALIAKGGDIARPSMWAPFVLVGDSS